MVEPVVNNRVEQRRQRVSADLGRTECEAPRNGKDWICNGRLMELKYLQTTFLRTLPVKKLFIGLEDSVSVQSGDFSWQTDCLEILMRYLTALSGEQPHFNSENSE